MSGHPDLCRIDALRTGEGTREDAEHLESCDACKGTLEELARGIASLAPQKTVETEIPPRVDEAILAEYRRVVRRRRAAPLWRRWHVPAFGLAAAAALVVALAGPQLRRALLPVKDGTVPAEAPTLAQVAKNPAVEGDVNGDGAVDILDAFFLARALESGGREPGSADFNGDGRVSLLDVDLLARRAVAL